MENEFPVKRFILITIVFFAFCGLLFGEYVWLRKSNVKTVSNSFNKPTFKDAQKLVSFPILQPRKMLGDEVLSEIRVGGRNNGIDDTDSIYLTYTLHSKNLYQIYESTKLGSVPADAESILVKPNVSGNFYRLPQAEIESSNVSASKNGSVPRSYIFWKEGSVHYSISEYGELSKENLMAIATSLK